MSTEISAPIVKFREKKGKYFLFLYKLFFALNRTFKIVF